MHRKDTVLEAFLEKQLEEGLALARDSDLLELMPLASASGAPDRYLARFHCKGLVKGADGSVRQADVFELGLWFPEDYLRCAQPPGTVLRWLGPHDVFHPNISSPDICVGSVVPATRLVDLLYQVFEMITYTKFNCASALNLDAADYARDHLGAFPIDRRPLKRRQLELDAVLLTGGARAGMTR